MSNNTYTAQPYPAIYMAFSDPGFHWGLFLPALFLTILAMIGMPLNASLCYVTIKYRSSLRFNTCILLALTSFFEILYQLGHFNFFVISLSAINFYPFRLALPLQSYSVIGCLADINQVALLSFDRLFSVMAPISYRQLNQRLYIFCHLLVNAGIIAIYFAQFFPSFKNLLEWPCAGYISDIVAKLGPKYIGLAMICAAILAYFFVAILIRLKTEVTTEKQQKIYHSLLLIVIVNVVAYFYSLIIPILYTSSLLPLDHLQFWYLNLFTCGLFFNIGAMSNAPILYYNSKDYRNVYKKEFTKLIQFFKTIYERQEQSTNRVYPIANQINIK